MKDNKIALRYAKALFEVAKEQHLEDNIRSSFLTTLNVLNEHNTLYKIIISPVIDYNSKIGIISKSKIKVNTESLFYNFLLLLIAKNRANLICDIQSNYETLYFDDKKNNACRCNFCF